MLAMSFADIKNRTVSVMAVVGMGLLLFLVRMNAGVEIKELLIGLLPGAFLLLTAVVTKERIGKGDGMAVCSLGVGYGVEDVLIILLSALFTAALTAIVLLVLRRADRKTELPFLPFLFCGWMVKVCTFLT